MYSNDYMYVDTIIIVNCLSKGILVHNYSRVWWTNVVCTCIYAVLHETIHNARMYMYMYMYTYMGIVQTCLHDLYDLNEFVHVFPGSHEAFEHEPLEVLVHVTVHSTHHLDNKTKATR